MQTTEQFCELSRVSESRSRAGTLELLAAVETFKASEEHATKDATQDFDGKKKG